MEPWRPALDTPDDWAAQPAWRWPWWKLGMQPDDLFKVLHSTYNTTEIPLQSIDAFHHDVSDVAAASTDTADFHRRMAVRQKQRLAEMIAALNHVALRATASPAMFDGTPSPTTAWADSVAFFRHRSLDSIVRFFGGLSATSDAAALPAPENKTSAVQEPLTPPPLDDEADLSLVSTVEDSMTSDSDHSVVYHPALHPVIASNDSPVRASPRLRHFAQPELADYDKKPLKPIALSRKPVARIQNKETKPAARKRKSAQADEAESQPVVRYSLRSAREPARVTKTRTGTTTAPSGKPKSEPVNTRQKRQRVS